MRKQQAKSPAAVIPEVEPEISQQEDILEGGELSLDVSSEEKIQTLDALFDQEEEEDMTGWVGDCDTTKWVEWLECKVFSNTNENTLEKSVNDYLAGLRRSYCGEGAGGFHIEEMNSGVVSLGGGSNRYMISFLTRIWKPAEEQPADNPEYDPTQPQQSAGPRMKGPTWDNRLSVDRVVEIVEPTGEK